MTAPTRTEPPAPAAAAQPDEASGAGLGDAVRRAIAQVRTGDLGPLPVVLGLVVIAIVFTSLSDVFATPRTLGNISQQIAAVGTISIGVVLVLLLGEIDLSVGSVSGLAAAVLVVLNTLHDVNTLVAVVAALLVGAAVGLVHGLVFTKLGVPSFVVTLAGLLGWLGLHLFVLGDRGTINLPPGGGLLRLGQASYLQRPVAYVVAIVVVVLFGAALLVRARRRSTAGLTTMSSAAIAVRGVGLLVVLLVAVFLLNKHRGVSTPLLIFLLLVVAFDLLLRKTRYGRAVYAVGGNIEAARRAGMNVDRIRISVFVLASTFAALGGVLATARLGSVSQSTGSGDVLINAIAAAVIGGTSLFGGRGSTYSALLGILVIGTISYGLTLISLSADARFMITGAVLLLAVVIDSISRRNRVSHGRA